MNGARIGAVSLDVAIHCPKLFNEPWINGHTMDKSNAVTTEPPMTTNGTKRLPLKTKGLQAIYYSCNIC